MPRRKRLLIVEDNPAEQLSIRELLGYDDIDVSTVTTGSEALSIIEQAIVRLRGARSATSRTCPVSMSWSACANMPQLSDLPVVVFTGKELSPEEDARLHMLARSVVVKGVESPERLLDETALFLHRVVADLPPEKQKMLDRLHRSDEALVGKKVSGRGRRRAQYLRAEQRAGTPRNDRADRGHRPRSHRHARIDSGPGDRADGHHDAGDGRLRNHAGDPAESFVPPACPSSR